MSLAAATFKVTSSSSSSLAEVATANRKLIVGPSENALEWSSSRWISQILDLIYCYPQSCCIAVIECNKGNNIITILIIMYRMGEPVGLGR